MFICLSMNYIKFQHGKKSKHTLDTTCYALHTKEMFENLHEEYVAKKYFNDKRSTQNLK